MPRRLLPLLFLVAVAAACTDPRPAPLESIRIGVLSPRSGALRALGPSWEDAARLAAEQVNAGGGLFGGRPLELIVGDSETNPEAAVALAQKLVAEGVVGLVGPASSGEAAAVLAQVAIPNTVPMVSCCATAESLTGGNQANSGYFFRTTPSDKLQGKALAHLADNGFSGASVTVPACAEAIFVHRDDPYGEGFATVFRDEYAGTISLTRPYGSATQEASRDELEAAADDVVARLTQSPPAEGQVCIVVISFVDDGSVIINRIDEQLQDLVTDGSPSFGYRFFVGDGANSSTFASATRSAAPRIVGTVPFRALDDDDAWIQFRKAWRARYPSAGEPVPFTAQSFDAVMGLALAIAQAGAEDPRMVRDNLFAVTSGGVLFKGRFFGEIAAALLDGTDVDYAGPSGAVDFDAFGDVVGDYVLWQVEDSGAGAVIVERDPLPAAVFNN